MLRVIQWATGNVGRHAVAAVHDHPDLELVGALVYSAEQVLALDADCRLLTSGKNVISTAVTPFIYPPSAGSAVRNFWTTPAMAAPTCCSTSWDSVGRGWKVTVEGRPSMMLEASIAIHDEDENDQGCLGTAMHAVHAIAPVCAAAPGIRTFLDLPTIVGRHAFG